MQTDRQTDTQTDGQTSSPCSGSGAVYEFPEAAAPVQFWRVDVIVLQRSTCRSVRTWGPVWRTEGGSLLSQNLRSVLLGFPCSSPPPAHSASLLLSVYGSPTLVGTVYSSWAKLVLNGSFNDAFSLFICFDELHPRLSLCGVNCVGWGIWVDSVTVTHF